MANNKFDFKKENLYDLLDLTIDCSKKDIIKAYRKKALKYHPDKNSDPSAVEVFHKLSKALEVLTDEAARTAFDRILKAREAAKVRHKQLDAKRQKFKEELEARESAGIGEQVKRQQEERNLDKEIERLRREGNSLLKQEQDLLQQQLERERKEQQSAGKNDSETTSRIKLHWKCPKNDPINGGYTESLLTDIFSKYGEVATVLLSSKKKGSALLEYSSTNAQIHECVREQGLTEYPLTVTWLCGKAPKMTSESDHLSQHPDQSQTMSHSHPSTTNQSQRTSSLASDLDFENIVMMKMRQAEERKRIIEEMKRQDEEEAENSPP